MLASNTRIEARQEIPADDTVLVGLAVVYGRQYMEFKTREFIAFFVVTLAVSSIAVLLRIYVRTWILRVFTLVDAFLLLSWILFFAERTLSLYSFKLLVKQPGGLPYTVGDSNSVSYLANVQQIIYSIEISAIKLAILLQLIELLTVAKSSWRWRILISLIVFNTAFYIAYFLVSVFQCYPREAIWTLGWNGRYCTINPPLQLAAGIVNLLIDSFVLVLPIRWIWSLQISKHRKAALYLIFSVGVLAVIASFCRLWYIARRLDNGGINVTFDVSVWTAVEMTACIVVCAAPPLAKLFARRRSVSSSQININQQKPKIRHRLGGLLSYAALRDTERAVSQIGPETAIKATEDLEKKSKTTKTMFRESEEEDIDTEVTRTITMEESWVERL